MASFEKRVARNGKASWVARIRKVGYPKQARAFPKLAQAKRWAADVEAEMSDGTWSPVGRQTVEDLVKSYLQDELGRLSPQEQIQRRRQMDWWRDTFGAVELRKLSPAMVAQGRKLLLEGKGPSGKRISEATANRYLAALSAACAVAKREWGWMETNPCRSVKRRGESRGRTRFLSDEERQRLAKAIGGRGRLRPLVILAMTTGARLGELMALRWGDLDFESRQATLRDTKNGDIRTVPLVEVAIKALLEHRKVRVLGDDRVFVGPGGACYMPRRAWNAARAESGLTDFRFHDLRHTAASYLAMSGASLNEIASILGHRTLAMVQRYAHLTKAHQVEVADRMAKKFPI